MLQTLPPDGAPRIARILLLVALAAALLGGEGGGSAGPAADASAAKDPPAAVLDALFPGGRRTEALALLAADELAPGESFRATELGRDAATSHHLVRIRDREELHRHERHDLVVVMLRGHGAMRIGDAERPVGAGSILYVPRGAPHAFRNAAPDPAVAYAIYVPPFDGKDRIPVAGDDQAR